ncbi:MAG TPA: family 1 glycosylhydrolase [Candidatus Acidoferrales bacterium]|nr:family 1 glycosylhydrolase [Candidatus Acidoferrales bacterium]
MAAFELWASPEPTVARIDARTYRDQLAETGHQARDGDVDLIADLGVSGSRYPVLWEKTAPDDPARPDLRWARARLEALRDAGVEPIVTLLHHGSGPPHTSLVAPDFPEKFAAYAQAVARAFPWVRRWTPINEPLTTARFSALYGHWYPNERSDAAFGAAIVNQALAMQAAMERIRRENPSAEFVITEDLQSFTLLDERVASYVEHKRERMYLSIELMMGRIREGHPLFAYLTEKAQVAVASLERLCAAPTPPDLVGWNYYPNSERALGVAADGTAFNRPAREVQAIGAEPLLRAAYRRLGLPFGLSEVHCHADEAGRVSWLRERYDDLVLLAQEGLPVRMLGAWAAFGLVDWNSLLMRRDGVREDGIYTFASADERPQPTAVAAELRALSRAQPVHAAS